MAFYDEVFTPSGDPRPHTEALAGALSELGREELADAGRRRDAIFMQQGITFDAGGPDVDGPIRDRPFPLDLVPRVIPAAEWTQIKRGLAQRIRALDRFVDDVYHGREIVHDGVVPWELIVSRPAFAREAHGIRPPGGVYCHVSGCDLVRDADGTWKVLEDNVRTPSGISYVLENRVAMLRLLPRLFNDYRVRPVDHYPALLATALRQVAPTEGEEEATVVVWTPGPFNSAYFEHTFLARQMGVELVEASDLVVRDAACYIRTTDGLQRVHAIYRRIDDDFMDPLEFRPDSLLGVPGLMRAYRAGTVAIVNAVGTGVADDKAIYHYVPDMIRYYLSEEPILSNVTTYLMADADQRKHVLDRLDQMVVKPTSESGGKGVFIGPAAGEEELARQADVVRREPERWIAQELVKLSTCPTASPDGSLAPRHVDLRPFAVFGEDIHIVPGGLTRVALREGSMIVNSSQGGGSKDTWVLEDDGDGLRTGGALRRAGPARRCPTCAPAPGPTSSNNSSSSDARPHRPRALLGRPQPLARRAHGAAARRRLPRRPAGPRDRRRLDAALVGGAAGDHGRRQRAANGRDDVISLLTLDPDDPASVLFCVSGAREGARRVRDVFSAEMWEAINTFHLGLLRRDMSAALRSGPYSLYAYVRERCALFWGVTDRTMLRDEARAFLEAGAAIEAGDMVLRMLRVALPTDEAEPSEADPRDGQAVALLQAMGGFQAFRRAIPAPPKASLVGSFLLYERAYPDSVAHSVSALHNALTAADSSYRSSAPVLRLSRLMADLDFRSRSVEGAGPLAQTLGPVQRELELVDGDIALRYFGGASAPVARLTAA